MAYTTIDKPDEYFNTVLYTGNNNVTQTITGVGFQPDLVWIKNRDNVEIHYLFDAVRGSGKILSSSYSSAEADLPVNTKPTIASDGFTLTSNGSNDELNFGTRTYVSWNWKAGTSFTNDASATGIGSIDSTGSVNTTSGFSIVSWTGTGSNGTIKHGLSTAPKWVICKRRDDDDSWWTYINSIGAGGQMVLHSTGAEGSDGGVLWNSTNPTSSVFSVGTNGGVNASGGTYIAYCFAEKKGFSKSGSWTGNASADGTFIYTGFKPAFLIVKKYNDAGYDWLMYDNKRQVSFNVVDDFLNPNADSAETTGNANQSLDFLSNGVKFRGSGASSNGSGASYIYMAFAENPFVTSTSIPTTAR